MQPQHTAHTLTKTSLKELVSFQARPCLSLYLGTHRSHPGNQQDPIRFRHLVAALRTSLQHQAPDAVHALIAPFEALEHDHAFWQHTIDGLVVMGAAEFLRIYLLSRPVADLAVVADSFHTQPLRQFLQSVERYQVLALSLHKVQLFEGNRDSLVAVSLVPEVPRSSSETTSDRQQAPHSSASSHGAMLAGHAAMHHGQGGKKDGMDSEAERFFRAVDRAVQTHHSDVSGLPLMLAALPEHHHLFQAISHNPLLMRQGLQVNPESLSAQELQQRVWAVAAPAQQAQQAAWCDDYAVAKAKGLGSDNLADVAHAAAAGRVSTLLIEAGRLAAGRIDGTTGRIDFAQLEGPRVDDVLDDLGTLVEQKGGQVHVLTADRMPTPTGVAASYRH
jgi:hypothetical protein